MLGAVAAVAVATAFVKPGPSSSRPIPGVHHSAKVGFSDTAETVMGTLVGPPNQRFLTRIRNGKMGGVVLLRNGWLTQSTAAAVTAELQRAACTRGEPLLVAVDQEGGSREAREQIARKDQLDRLPESHAGNSSGRRRPHGSPRCRRRGE